MTRSVARSLSKGTRGSGENFTFRTLTVPINTSKVSVKSDKAGFIVKSRIDKHQTDRHRTDSKGI